MLGCFQSEDYRTEPASFSLSHFFTNLRSVRIWISRWNLLVIEVWF